MSVRQYYGMKTKIQFYDDRGRPRWLGVGQIAPAGWYSPSGELLKEPHIVVLFSYVDPDGCVVKRLIFEPVSAQEERRKAAKVNEEGRAKVDELNSRIAAAGIDPAVLRFEWVVPLNSDGMAIGHMEVAGRVVGYQWRKVEVADAFREVELLIERARPVQARLEAERRRDELEMAVKAAGESAGYPAGRIVTRRGAWIPHDESFGGLDGGDYAEWEEWEWADWAKRALARAEKGEDINLACQDEIERAKAGEHK